MKTEEEVHKPEQHYNTFVGARNYVGREERGGVQGGSGEKGWWGEEVGGGEGWWRGEGVVGGRGGTRVVGGEKGGG